MKYGPIHRFVNFLQTPFLVTGSYQRTFCPTVLRVCGIAIVIELCGSIAIVYVLFCYFTGELNFWNRVVGVHQCWVMCVFVKMLRRPFIFWLYSCKIRLLTLIDSPICTWWLVELFITKAGEWAHH